jgi:hypothetical protein
MKRRHFILFIGLLVAAWLAFFADKTSNDGLVEEASRKEKSVNERASPKKVENVQSTDDGEIAVLALRSRAGMDDALAISQSGLFANQTWTPPPPPPPPIVKMPPPLPTAPPVPFVYLGKKLEDKNWQIFLARGEQIYVVEKNEVIDGTYRILEVRPPTLSLIYLPLNQTQTLAIGSAE